jgi:hypothetical protein
VVKMDKIIIKRYNSGMIRIEYCPYLTYRKNISILKKAFSIALHEQAIREEDKTISRKPKKTKQIKTPRIKKSSGSH